VGITPLNPAHGFFLEADRPISGSYYLRKANETTLLTVIRDSVKAVGLATFSGEKVLDVWYPDPTDTSADLSDMAMVDEGRRVETRVITTAIDDLSEPPSDPTDAYLRLHLLSHRVYKPNEISVEGIFATLNNVVWTSEGPCDVENFTVVKQVLIGAGRPPLVRSVDKFPRMIDYVIPIGVRIANGDRVRLGAYLGEGTVVMHEGFVNFNAGTLGTSMVEGRISSGVLVGDGSDIGGGASIMGTLSGGGTEVISIGKDCLLGANSGIGISLGDGCVVEAGLYVTAGTVITLPDGETAKGRELSGVHEMLFRRNSVTGAVEALPRSGSWGGLNEALHAN
jgi:2,3,4,5-tetrahydropyridine-2,6-dicarboxylate N-succinyltransferase